MEYTFSFQQIDIDKEYTIINNNVIRIYGKDRPIIRHTSYLYRVTFIRTYQVKIQLLWKHQQLRTRDKSLKENVSYLRFCFVHVVLSTLLVSCIFIDNRLSRRHCKEKEKRDVRDRHFRSKSRFVA